MPRAPSARELDEAVARCHSNPSAAITAAKRGSHIDLTALSEIAGKLPAKVARDAFVLFFSKLIIPAKGPASSSGPPELSKAEFREASCAVIGISKIVITYFNLPSEKAYYMPLITKFWNKLLECTEYVLTIILDAVAASPDPNAVPSPNNVTGFKSATFSNVASLYTILFHASEELCDLRSAKIVARIWATTAPTTDPNISASAHAMKVLCFKLGHNCWQALDCLIKVCGNSVDRVAELAKERLVVSLKRSPIDYEEVESHVEAILMLSDDERRSFRSSFLKMKGVGAATEGFLILAKESRPITDKKKQAIEACTSFYYHMFRSQVGIPWIIEGTRRGLFEILARLSVAFTGDEKARLTVDNVKDLFNLFLPKHLVYYSVIGAVGTGLDRSARLLLALSASNCRVRDDWKQFCAIVLERIIQKHVYETVWASDKKGMTIICSTCSKVDMKNTFRRCSGCLGAMYCSKECQAEDWKNKGHKTQCKYLAGSTDIAPLRHKDDKFLATFAQQEILRYAPGLRKIAERDFPGVPRTKLGYIIDCTTIPLTFGHFRLDGEVGGRGETLSHARPELRKMALESNGEGSLVTLRLQQGTGYQEKNLMIGVSERTTPEHPTSFPRLVGRDSRGNVLETRSDVVDLILHDLGIKDPVSWLFESQTPVEHLCKRIDQDINSAPSRAAPAEDASTLNALLSPLRLLGLV